MRRYPLLGTLLAVAIVGCGDDDTPVAETATLNPPSPVAVRVSETLRVPLTVNNPDVLSLSYSFDAPTVPTIGQSAEIGGTPFGGTFAWRPIASEVGQHTVTLTVTSPIGAHSQPLDVTVGTAPTAAPSFVTPDVGATYDLGANPWLACLRRGP
ncbi:hypothetical protein [Microbacterium sp.]